jgi:integrase
MAGHSTDAETQRWVSTLDVKLLRKLVKAGLVASREAATLGAFLAAYIGSRADVKPGTRINFGQVQRDLLAFYGEQKRLEEISRGDADAFRLHLLKSLGDNTVRRRCGRAKQFFRAAVRKRLITENPFGDMKAVTVRANRERDHFVTREDADKVLEACPDAQWRLIFALSRYGGLRCPSEHLALRWGEIDWAGGRMTVRSPKTEHNEGGESRIVPIFPELRPYLDAAFSEADEGAEFVISKYRSGNTNLRTQLQRILARAGVKPWPKLFQNLRATQETELAANHPIHVVCEWIGNSQAVARKHYLRVTKSDFVKASEGPEKSGAVGAKTVQNVGQHTAARLGSIVHESSQHAENCSMMRDEFLSCPQVQDTEVTPTGLEPVLPP